MIFGGMVTLNYDTSLILMCLGLLCNPACQALTFLTSSHLTKVTLEPWHLSKCRFKVEEGIKVSGVIIKHCVGLASVHGCQFTIVPQLFV